MTAISIQDLQPSGSNLLIDSESYLTDLSYDVSLSISGGMPTTLPTIITHTSFSLCIPYSPWCAVTLTAIAQ